MAFSDGAQLLNLIIFMPVALGLLCLAVPERITRFVALGVSLLTFVLSIVLYKSYDPAGAEFQFGSNLPWIPQLGINYQTGIDGVSMILILLTTFLMPIGILSAFDSIKDRSKEFYFFLLFLETGIIGAFSALDIFLFYIFWEAMLIPMYFIIGIWV